MLHEYGCATCGGTNFKGKDGELVIGAGIEGGVPHVKKMRVEQDADDGAAWVGRSWLCAVDTTHDIPLGSPLAAFLALIPEDTVVPLQRNR